MSLPLLPLLLSAQVVVQLPASANAEAWERVLRSCNSVLGDNACAKTEAASAQSTATHSSVAELWWEQDTLHLRFSVVRGADHETLERSLSFEGTDPDAERWVAAGLMIAAVAASLQDDARAAEAAPPTVREDKPRQSTPAENPTPAAAPAMPTQLDVPPRDEPQSPRKARPPLHFDLGLTVTPGANKSDWRMGPLLRATWLTFGDYGLTADVRSVYGSDVVRLQTYSVALGPTLRFGSRSLIGLDAHAAGLVEWTVASATREETVDTARATRFGGRAALHAWFGMTEHVSAWLSADLSHLTPDLEVQVGGVSVANEQSPHWSTSAGLRFELEP